MTVEEDAGAPALPTVVAAAVDVMTAAKTILKMMAAIGARSHHVNADPARDLDVKTSAESPASATAASAPEKSARAIANAIGATDVR
jgi:hypothetical protein